MSGKKLKKIRLVCPLLNFQIQNIIYSKGERPHEETTAILVERHNKIINGIELFEDVIIRPFNHQDIIDINSGFLFSFTGLREYISTNSYLLEKIITPEEGQVQKTQKQMRNIVLALRLLQKEHVYGDDVFCLDSESGHCLSWSREGLPPTPTGIGTKYALNFDDISQLKKIIDKVQKVDFQKRKSFDLACRRFQRTYQEIAFDDRLIDYMIAFEALFLKGERQAQSRGKIIAIACSILLGETDEERETIKKKLNSAYSLRNRIVHGGDCGTNNELAKIIIDIDEYLRESIVKFLE